MYMTINRYVKLKKNEDIHQTKMMFDLIKICQISCDNNTSTNICLPKDKIKSSRCKQIFNHNSSY